MVRERERRQLLYWERTKRLAAGRDKDGRRKTVRWDDCGEQTTGKREILDQLTMKNKTQRDAQADGYMLMYTSESISNVYKHKFQK